MMSNFIGVERLTLGPWQALERATQRFFIHSGFNDCRLVGGPGDQGADILANKNGRLWVTQVKFRRASVAVNQSAVKEVVEAINSYSADEAVVVTNQHFSPDAYEAAERFSRDTGIPIRLWPSYKILEWARKLPEYPSTRRELRPYQEQAIDAVDTARSQGRRLGLLTMATGLGKTRIAGEIILREILNRPDMEVLVLTHRIELAHQFEAALWEVLPKNTSTHIWAGGEYPAFSGGVTCATEQTVIEAIKTENLEGRYSLIVVDEAHHAPAEGYQRLLELLKPNFLLGLTATPWRSDERLLSDMFGPPIFSMSIVEGMQQGYLAGVDYRMLVDDVDWEEVPRLSKQRLRVSELNRKLFLPQRDEAIIAKLVDHLDAMENARCIVFCRTIDHANTVYRFLRAAGKPCRVIHSDLGRIEAANTLREFRAGKNPTLISVDMLNEGIDVPDVNVVVFLRVTHSRRIFVQQLGRGLRIREGKSTVKVLDFVADIRRVAAGLGLNKEAAEFARSAVDKEWIRFPDGKIVAFSNDSALSFFQEYLEDVAAVEDLDEDARLKFPPPVTKFEEK
jgi:superfamily II DNA or RNA helicase